MRPGTFFLIAVLACSVTACAILQGDNKEKKVQAFMNDFRKSLKEGDDAALKFFDSEQSHETLVSVIDILQNQDSALVSCQANFNDIEIEFNPEQTIVKLAANFVAISGERKDNINLEFWLTPKGDSFTISQLFGEIFYITYTNLKHDIQYASHVENELKERQEIYNIASNLESKFDSLIWYAQYRGKLYFYVVSGPWDQQPVLTNAVGAMTGYKMGLIDETGKEIVPMEYQMIGTLGAHGLEGVEVKSENGFGFYDLSGAQLVPAQYELLIPYDSYWIVRQEGSYGWLRDDTVFHAGYPDDGARNMIQSFGFVNDMTINADNFSLCEALDPERAGAGTFITPSYYAAFEIMPYVQSGFTTTATDAPIGGWTEYTEVRRNWFEQISDKVGILVVNFKERYLEGREEFYTKSKISFTDRSHSTLVIDEFPGDEVRFKKLPDNLLEIESISRPIDMMGNGALEYHNFSYYQLDDEGSISRLQSNRYCPETQFVKLDSGYLFGSFSYYDETTGSPSSTNFKGLEELESMRNQILADNGYTFPDEQTLKYYQQQKWYSPRFNKLEDVEASLSDIDRYNLHFLARMIDLRRQEMQTEGDI